MNACVPLLGELEKFAEARGARAAQIAIAWALAARTRRQLDETLSALNVKLSREDIVQLEGMCAPGRVAGTLRRQPHANTR
jgi:aryl-alcohol dehydrogenase-like predicted oxidoreductase